MKKYFYALTAALMALTSCSSDEEVMKAEVDEPTTVTISAYLPDYVKSRVTTDDKNIPGQGNKIAKIEYAILDQYGKIIYHSGQTGAVQPEKDANDHGHYTFTVELLKNHKYHFYLWASAATSPYTFIPEAGTVDESGTMTGGPRVTMDYSKVKANDESMDAFFGMHTYTIDNEKQANDERYMITLTRPFAQLNILINDKETIEKIENNTHSRTIESITVKVAQTPGRYQSLNLHSFVASNPLDAAFTFTAAYPNGWDDLVHAGDGDVAHYYYLATCYLLTGISPDGTTKGIKINLYVNNSVIKFIYKFIACKCYYILVIFFFLKYYIFR